MISKKARGGSRVAGILYYLWGPGRANEHTNPHMVAAWDDGIIKRFDPALPESPGVPALARLLELPVEAMEGKKPSQHVYHVPVRLDPNDRALSDTEWNEVAREILDSVGLAPKNHPERSVRWIAMRHADDHMHIVATLADGNGRVPNLRGDYKKMQARSRELERRFGLRQLRSGDKTAQTWPTTAELEKAKRNERVETPRVTLQRTVREAAAAATSEADFFARLTRAGVRVQQRTAPDGAVTGYSVALPGDRTGRGRAVWFSGSRLAPDLSLPRVRERWLGAGSASLGPQPRNRAEAWQMAADQVQQATRILARAGDAQGAALVSALGDTLTTAAAHAPSLVRDELREAAKRFERAGRAPLARQAQADARRGFQTASQALMVGTVMATGGGEAAAAVLLLVALAAAALAAYQWHQAREFTAQAEAAAAAGRNLRAATEMTRGAATSGQGRGPGRRRVSPTGKGGASGEAAHAATVRSTLPERAEEILMDEAWPALAATMDAAERAGYDTAAVLGEVTAQRELGSADSVAQVLTWRLQGRMRRDAENPTKTTTTRPTKTGPTKPGRPGNLGEQNAAQRAAQNQTQDNQNRRGRGR